MHDLWHTLRQYTQARIAQGRSGCGMRTASLLDFQLAHAMARDAVHLPWDTAKLAQDLGTRGLETMVLSTRVRDRVHYLKRPDLGRTLDQTSRDLLAEAAGRPADVALILSNGLSSAAMERHGLALSEAIVERLGRGHLIGSGTNADACIAPIVLVPNGRVALSDEIGALMKARLTVIVVGERPGLSAADSLGIYMTYGPKPGNTDAERNCISNIRPPEGLSYREAAEKLGYLAGMAMQRGLSGVALKDDMPAPERLVHVATD
jgi:ethanolamine ammonia-lyase small subunit